MTLGYDEDGLTTAQLARFPALHGYVALTVPAGTAVKSLLKGKLLVTQADDEGTLQAASGVQVPGVLDALYASKVKSVNLGVTWLATGRPKLSLWAPTAQSVSLLVWPNGDTTKAPTVVPAKRWSTGVWALTGAKEWKAPPTSGR